MESVLGQSYCNHKLQFTTKLTANKKVRYNKSYNAATEAFRRSIWEAKKNMIDKHNAEADQGLQSYYMVDNQFADMVSTNCCEK